MLTLTPDQKNILQPTLSAAVFLSTVYFAGAQRQIKVLQGVSRGQLVEIAIVGSLPMVGGHFNQAKVSKKVQTIVLLALTLLVYPKLVELLTNRVHLKLQDSLSLFLIGSVSYQRVEWLLSYVREVQENQCFLKIPNLGKEVWEKYYGEVGDEPPLPDDIETILNADCPFVEGMKVCQTHILALVPKTVNGRPYGLNYLGELVCSPKEGVSTRYTSKCKTVLDKIGDTPSQKSEWVLMTKDIIPGSRGKTLSELRGLVEKYSDYELPPALHAATVIALANVSGTPHEFRGKPWTYTCCSELFENDPSKVYPMHEPTVGGISKHQEVRRTDNEEPGEFHEEGFRIYYWVGDSLEDNGLAGYRRLG